MSADGRRFPIMLDDRYRGLGIPSSIPWRILEPHERQALRNHAQDLVTLARRGGLEPHEVLAVLTDRSWTEVRRLDAAQVWEQLRPLLEGAP